MQRALPLQMPSDLPLFSFSSLFLLLYSSSNVRIRFRSGFCLLDANRPVKVARKTNFFFGGRSDSFSSRSVPDKQSSDYKMDKKYRTVRYRTVCPFLANASGQRVSIGKSVREEGTQVVLYRSHQLVRLHAADKGGPTIKLLDGHKALIGFKEETMEGRTTQRLLVIMLTEGEAETVAQQLLCQSSLASESMNNPRYSGTHLPLQLQQFVDSLHQMEYERLPARFGQQSLTTERENLLLQGGIGTFVKSRLAYRPYTGAGSGLFQCLPRGLGSLGDVPRVNAYRIASAGLREKRERIAADKSTA